MNNNFMPDSLTSAELQPTVLAQYDSMPGGNGAGTGGEAATAKPRSILDSGASQNGSTEPVQNLNEMAVPESPDGYVFTFSEDTVVDENALNAFRDVAFKEGISQGQAERLTALYASLVEQQQAEQQSRLAEAEAGWLKELKQNRNYTKTVASARLAMERFGTPELNDLLNESRLGSHPALVNFVARIGQELAEPSFMPNKAGGKGASLNFYETMNS